MLPLLFQTPPLADLLDGTAALALSASGILTTEIRADGAAALSLSASATLTTEITVQGAAPLGVTTAAQLTTEITATAAAALVMGASGQIEGTPALFEAEASLQLAGTAALTTEIRLAGSALTVMVTNQPALVTQILMQAATQMALTALAELSASSLTGGVVFLAPSRLRAGVAIIGGLEKQPGERFPVGVDFSALLALLAGESLTGAVVTARRTRDGADVTDALFAGGAAVTATVAKRMLVEGEHGEAYVVQFRAPTTMANTYEAEVELAVREV